MGFKIFINTYSFPLLFNNIFISYIIQHLVQYVLRIYTLICLDFASVKNCINDWVWGDFMWFIIDENWANNLLQYASSADGPTVSVSLRNCWLSTMVCEKSF